MKNIKRAAISGTVGIAISSGIVMLLMSILALFQNTFCEMHGYSAQAFSIAISVLSGGDIIAGLFIGKLIPTVGIKKLTIIASFAPLAAAAGIYFCGNLAATYAIALACGVLVGLVTPAVMNMYIGSWFDKGTGTMVSVAQIISKAASILLIPAATKLLLTMGKESALVVGAGMTVVSLIGAVFMKGMPSDYGVERVNLIEKDKKSGSSAAAEEVYDVQMPAAKLLTKLPAICALLMTFLCIVVSVMTSTYGVYMYDSYINNMEAASYYMAVRTVATLAFTLLFGILCDKIGIWKSILFYGALFAVSSVLGPIIGGKAGVLILACFSGTIVFSTMFIGIGLPLIVGYKNMPTFAGWAGALMSVGGMLGPVLAIALVNADGGAYNLLNYVAGAIVLVATLMCVYSISKRGRASMKAADEAWLAKSPKA
ncbi:MAG: MFS transporter [Oscillospiraceae bacterium]|nr:MFS transporter [Oscillospiraceae bacterium]